MSVATIPGPPLRISSIIIYEIRKHFLGLSSTKTKHHQRFSHKNRLTLWLSLVHFRLTDLFPQNKICNEISPAYRTKVSLRSSTTDDRKSYPSL